MLTEPAMYQEIRREWKIKRNRAQRAQDYFTKQSKRCSTEQMRYNFEAMAQQQQNIASEMSINLEKFKVQNHGTKSKKEVK